MATVTRYVDAASAAGGDGTTPATSGATRAYSTQSEWDAAEQTDLVTDTDVHVLNCGGTTADTAALVIDGWTTGASNDITINGNNTTGAWNTSTYRHSPPSGGIGVQVEESYVSWYDMQQENNNVTGTYYNMIDLQPGSGVSACDYTISRCIFDGQGNNRARGINFGSVGTGTGRVYNSIVNDITVGSASVGIQVEDTGWTDIDLFNNTVYNCISGIKQTAGTVTATNNASFGNTDDFVGTITVTFCASDDGDGTDSVSPADWGAVFVDYVNADFHLKSTDTDLINAGTDLSAFLTDDIEGDTRSTFDIGADEYVSAGQSDSIPAGSLRLTSFAPVDGISGTFGQGIPFTSLKLTTFAPVDKVTGSFGQGIPSTTLKLTPFALVDKVSGSFGQGIPAAGLTLTPFAPIDVQAGGQRDAIPGTTLKLTTFAPTTKITGSFGQGIPSNVLKLTTFAPSTGIPSAVEEEKKKGGAKRKHRQKVVIIGGEKYLIENQYQLYLILQRYREEQISELQEEQISEVPNNTKIKLISSKIKRVETRIEKVGVEWEEELLILASI